MSIKRKITSLIISILLSIWIFKLLSTYHYAPKGLIVEIIAEYNISDRFQLFWSYGEKVIYTEKNSNGI